MKKQTKKIKKANKKHETGRSMIEMVGVLAIMGLVTAAAFVLITSAMRSQKISRADDDISALVAGVRLLYANGTAGFDGIGDVSKATLSTLGYGSVKPVYGKDDTYTLKAIGCGANGTGTDCFTISFDTGDAGMCSGLASRSWGNGGAAWCEKDTILYIKFTDGRGDIEPKTPKAKESVKEPISNINLKP